MSGATLLAGASLVVLLAGCAAVEPIDSLVELGTLEIAAGARFAGHEVGGLSGLDYDAAHGDWIAISDQRGDHGAPGIYRLHLDLDGNAAPGVTIGAAVALQAPPGTHLSARPWRSGLRRGGRLRGGAHRFARRQHLVCR